MCRCPSAFDSDRRFGDVGLKKINDPIRVQSSRTVIFC
jgi:hypothetical protein